MKIKVSTVFILLLWFPWAASAADVEAGKKLYSQICFYCHKNTYDDKFGPGLAGILDRRDEAWLHEFLKNPSEMARKDEDAKGMSEGYAVSMPTLPEMQDEQKRADIIAYMATLE